MSDGDTTQLLVAVVDEDPLQGGDDDGVSDLHSIEVVEGVAVGRAVARNGGVASLARHRGADVVARSLAQVRGVGALDHDLVDADDRDADVADRFALGRVLRAGGRDGRAGRELVERGRVGQGLPDLLVVGLLDEGVAQDGLAVGLLNGGAPDLVRREQEDDDAQPDQDPSDDVDRPAHVGRNSTAARPSRRVTWDFVVIA